MPIRIRKDDEMPQDERGNRRPNQPERRDNGNKGMFPGGGGGGILAAVIGLLFKKPKLLIGLLVIGGIIYFMSGGFSGNEGGGGNNPVVVDPNNGGQTIQTDNSIARGAELDQKVYDEAEVYEPLADNIKNPMPESSSLVQYCPTRLSQGSQGSCVAWASSYAARTILYAKETGKDPNKVRFSPSFLYNQIALTGCQGAYIFKAMEHLKQRGDVPFSQFGYDARDCSKSPSRQDFQDAKSYTIAGFNRLTKSGSNYKTDLLGIKQHISHGAPVVVGMMVGGSFMSSMNGKDKWFPTQGDYSKRGFGGHAMCVVGYDDYKFGRNMGGFHIMNSWGMDWGNKGMFWVSYDDFGRFTEEAYGMFPMGDANSPKTNRLDVAFALVRKNSGKRIDISHSHDRTYKTNSPLKIGEQFKIEIANTLPCYTYIVGLETDNTSYILFPYTKKHSPYCGITGTRLFPRDYSYEADNIGTVDQMAVIVSKGPLDYNQLISSINSHSGSFDQKIQGALGNIMNHNASFSGNGQVNISADDANGTAVYAVLEIEKR